MTKQESDQEERATRIAMMQALTTLASRPVAERQSGARTEIVGIFALLIGMLIQTGAGFFWAGGMSKSYDALDKSIVEVKAQQTYQSAQLQVLDGQMKRAEGKAEAAEKAAVEKRR